MKKNAFGMLTHVKIFFALMLLQFHMIHMKNVLMNGKSFLENALWHIQDKVVSCGLVLVLK